ncbi:MAG: pyruvate oxidase, partial [Oxalobacter sp.]|nr:pyruvate oxidase [Oxalobacter sp.]
SVLAKGIVPDDYKNFLGMAARVATKPANEALAMADLIVFIGSDFPFARAFFSPAARFIQVDIDSSKLGRRHHADVAILGDARETMRQMVAKGKRKEAGKWLEANRLNREGWDVWLKGFKDSDAVPMRVEPVFHEINRIAEPDAIFVTDVGNSTIHAVRLLEMNAAGQQFTTSGWFATMGYGIPGGIAARLSYPHRQVFTLNGDGAFAMSMQDIITQVRYNLPVINIVFSNDSLGFIEAEQEDSRQEYYGVDLTPVDFAKAAEAMGAVGFTVTKPEQLEKVFTEASRSEKPVVIDVKVDNKRPFPAESFVLDGEKYSKAEIDAFKKRYEVRNMPVLRELLG